MTDKGERRSWRRFIRATRQCRRGRQRALKPAALTVSEMVRVEMFEAQMMFDLTMMMEVCRG